MAIFPRHNGAGHNTLDNFAKEKEGGGGAGTKQLKFGRMGTSTGDSN